MLKKLISCLDDPLTRLAPQSLPHTQIESQTQAGIDTLSKPVGLSARVLEWNAIENTTLLSISQCEAAQNQDGARMSGRLALGAGVRSSLFPYQFFTSINPLSIISFRYRAIRR